jgi:uncharacterized protein (DUF983 family)
MGVETWTAAGNGRPTSDVDPAGRRSVWTAIKRGFAGRCPHCGDGRLFGRYLKVVDHCEACGEAFHHHRADDLPPYLTILVVGHLVVPVVLWVEQAWQPDIWLQMAVWLPLTVVLTMLFLQPVKGAVVGLQWANRMHGFGTEPDEPSVPAGRSEGGHGR